MAEHTNIQWTDHTFNPWWGCTNCYAEALDRRTGGDHWGVGKARRRTSPKNWGDPLKWCAAAEKAGVRRRVFCASMADWLDDAVPVEWLADLLYLVGCTRRGLDWLLLTKRPEHWRARVEAALHCRDQPAGMAAMLAAWLTGHPPENVWVGTTVEDQRRATERVPVLLDIPATVHFLSCEPLLEPVDLNKPMWRSVSSVVKYGDSAPMVVRPILYGVSALTGEDQWGLETWSDGRRIDWVIVGGESGAGARPFDLAWARSLVLQCQPYGVACFVKQLGSKPIAGMGDFVGLRLSQMTGQSGDGTPDTIRVRLQDGKGADPAEWPADLRIRQFPTPRPA